MNPPARLEVAATCFTAERVAAYGALTRDFNPIHLDVEFAAGTRFGRPIVHGLAVVAPVWASLEATFEADGMAGATSELRFVAPTPVGTTPAYVLTLEAVAHGRAVYQLEVHSEDGTLVVRGHISLPWPLGA